MRHLSILLVLVLVTRSQASFNTYTREELVAREAWAPLATIAGIVAKNL